MNRSTSRSTTTRSRRRIHAIDAFFGANGVLVASWVARLPAVRSRLDATEPQLGVALLAIALGALLAMPATAWLCERFGTRRVLVTATIAATALYTLAVAVPSIPLLGVVLLFVGVAYGTWDVSMNAAAHDVEQDSPGRVLMPRFHGVFSVGGLAGAALGGLAAAAGLPVQLHLAVIGAAVVTTALAAAAHIPNHVITEHTESAPERRGTITPRLVALGLLLACVTLGEGAAADWGAIFLHDERQASESIAAIGYAAFAAAMAVGRFSGAWLLRRMSRTSALRWSGLLTAAAVVTFVSVDAVAAGILAMVGWGLGVAIVFPAAMSAAGESSVRPAHGIAVVATIGYGGFLVGPPTVGFIAGESGLGRGLLVVAALALVVVALAPVSQSRRHRHTGGDVTEESVMAVASGCAAPSP